MPLRTDWLLPPDLEFIIIDHILDDKPTLASCSLVCSRWLLPSRKHLFKDIAVQLAAVSLADFFRFVEHSGKVTPIGPHVKKFTLEGTLIREGHDVGTPTATFALSVLRALLSKLPHLASLCVTRCLLLDDTSQQPNGTQCQHAQYELDELSVIDCSGPTRDPRHLLAQICTFSSIGSLSVHRWGRRWMWMGGPLPTFSPVPFSPPIVRSLDVEQVEEGATRVLYALVASSRSITNACLTRISVHLAELEELRRFANLANLAGTALRDIVVRGDRDIRLDRMLQSMPLTTCTALSSLTLSAECIFEDPVPAARADHARETRGALRQYAQILGMYRVVFAGLTRVRLEMRPASREMFDAFVRVTQDTCRIWPEEEVLTVDPDEEQQNMETWALLESILCDFPALKRVEFVLLETSQLEGALREEAKIELRGALEGRLPRLGPSAIAQLVFEHCSR